MPDQDSAPAGAAGPGPRRRLGEEFFAGDPLSVAPALLNKLLVRSDGRAARLVEVEAYRGSADPGSHAFKGPTLRNRSMFGPPGHLYVYFTYGMHWCANVVCGASGEAAAVLLRAARPIDGVELMRAARWRRQRTQRYSDLCRGPARLCQAFDIATGYDGVALYGPDALVWIADDGIGPPPAPGVSKRIGLSAGSELPWRYFVPGDPGLSGAPGLSGTPRPRKRAAAWREGYQSG